MWDNGVERFVRLGVKANGQRENTAFIVIVIVIAALCSVPILRKQFEEDLHKS